MKNLNLKEVEERLKKVKPNAKEGFMKEYKEKAYMESNRVAMKLIEVLIEEEALAVEANGILDEAKEIIANSYQRFAVSELTKELFNKKEGE